MWGKKKQPTTFEKTVAVGTGVLIAGAQFLLVSRVADFMETGLFAIKNLGTGMWAKAKATKEEATNADSEEATNTKEPKKSSKKAA